MHSPQLYQWTGFSPMKDWAFATIGTTKAPSLSIFKLRNRKLISLQWYKYWNLNSENKIGKVMGSNTIATIGKASYNELYCDNADHLFFSCYHMRYLRSIWKCYTYLGIFVTKCNARTVYWHFFLNYCHFISLDWKHYVASIFKMFQGIVCFYMTHISNNVCCKYKFHERIFQ